MKKKADNKKEEQLKQIYGFFDRVIKPFDVVCKEKCAACCTCNVTMTGLETRYLVHSMSPDEKESIAHKMVSNFPKKRFIPKMTTNRFARLCMEGSPLPDEENDPAWGACPLLVDGSCSIYDVRPFGCRALLSTVDCEKKGYARVSPLVLTIQNLFMQAIEHLDNNGTTGNLSDMITCLLQEGSIKGELDVVPALKDLDFIENEKISVLMVPPEHRDKVKTVREQLSNIIS